MPSALDTLTACPLFEGLPPKGLQQLAQDLRERRYEAGETITSQDTGGVAFFILGEGRATVSVNGVERASLEPGATFGEIGLLTGAKRTAAIVADGDVQCWTLSQWNFKPLVMTNPQIAWRLLENLARRIVAVGG